MLCEYYICEGRIMMMMSFSSYPTMTTWSPGSYVAGKCVLPWTPGQPITCRVVINIGHIRLIGNRSDLSVSSMNFYGMFTVCANITLAYSLFGPHSEPGRARPPRGEPFIDLRCTLSAHSDATLLIIVFTCYISKLIIIELLAPQFYPLFFLNHPYIPSYNSTQ